MANPAWFDANDHGQCGTHIGWADGPGRHISWLRKKIEDDPSHPTYITTIRGVGFRFRSDAET
jgi:hypothetical protein